MSQELPVIQETGTRCKNLMSKGLFINAGLPKDQHVVGDGHFWCLKTQASLGPDRELCGGEYCTDPTRTCYEI
ncbi:MAG TPA: hypothetical protein VMM56_13645 [Planctomycetaceae bacterium]|nr:hypothetical protein [Planctomycetaceae bacterium]